MTSSTMRDFHQTHAQAYSTCCRSARSSVLHPNSSQTDSSWVAVLVARVLRDSEMDWELEYSSLDVDVDLGVDLDVDLDVDLGVSFVMFISSLLGRVVGVM